MENKGWEWSASLSSLPNLISHMNLARKPYIFTFFFLLFSQIVCVFNQLLHNRSGWFNSRFIPCLLSARYLLWDCAERWLNWNGCTSMLSYVHFIWYRLYRLSQWSLGQLNQDIMSKTLGTEDKYSTEFLRLVEWYEIHTRKSY